MTVGEKIKTINNKIEKNKARCNLVGRYGFLTVEDIELQKKLKKAPTIRRFGYSPVGIELKKQTDIARKQYELIKVHGLNKTVMSKKRENSDLLYNNFDFKKFNITDEECYELSADTKYKHLKRFSIK